MIMLKLTGVRGWEEGRPMTNGGDPLWAMREHQIGRFKTTYPFVSTIQLKEFLGPSCVSKNESTLELSGTDLNIF